MILHIVAGGNGEAANDLLGEFLEGYPLDRLRTLLRSESPRAATAGAFIASELGDRFAPLISEALGMLNHQVADVRFDALDVVLLKAGVDQADLLAQAIGLVHDPDSSVRWKALRFLTRMTEKQMAAASKSITDERLANLMSWLVAVMSGEIERAKKDIEARLSEEDVVVSSFAAVAAARLAPDDPRLLRIASRSEIPEIGRFASDELELLEV